VNGITLEKRSVFIVSTTVRCGEEDWPNSCRGITPGLFRHHLQSPQQCTCLPGAPPELSSRASCPWALCTLVPSSTSPTCFICQLPGHRAVHPQSPVSVIWAVTALLPSGQNGRAKYGSNKVLSANTRYGTQYGTHMTSISSSTFHPCSELMGTELGIL